jgi:electron transfer flavoprotein alpha subunit
METSWRTCWSNRKTGSATNLYIAIGISGAIQHMRDKLFKINKVVINNDPAPFSKVADYGMSEII